jgi:hypothetical protein
MYHSNRVNMPIELFETVSSMASVPKLYDEGQSWETVAA